MSDDKEPTVTHPIHGAHSVAGGAPIRAHSKTQYKRLVTQGANVLPPGAPTPETDKFLSEEVNSIDNEYLAFMRNLERQRDAALHTVELRDADIFVWHTALDKAEAELAATKEQLAAEKDLHNRTIEVWGVDKRNLDKTETQLAAANKRAEGAERDAKRWRAVPAFLTKYRIDYLGLLRDVVEFNEEKGDGNG